MADIQRYGEEFQRASKDGFDASVRSFGEVSKGFQAIAATFVDYSKKSFEDGTRVQRARSEKSWPWLEFPQGFDRHGLLRFVMKHQPTRPKGKRRSGEQVRSKHFHSPFTRRLTSPRAAL